MLTEWARMHHAGYVGPATGRPIDDLARKRREWDHRRWHEIVGHTTEGALVALCGRVLRPRGDLTWTLTAGPENCKPSTPKCTRCLNTLRPYR